MDCPYCNDATLENHSKEELVFCFRRYLEDSTPTGEPSQKQMDEYMRGLGYQPQRAETFGAESVKPTITNYKLIKNQEIDWEQMEITVDYQGMPYSGILDGGYWGAETFGVEFNEWADQEMLTHGQDISFRDWAKDEGEKHGNVPITDWAEHEEESHDKRYGAETFEAWGRGDSLSCPNCNGKMKDMGHPSEFSPNYDMDNPLHYNNIPKYYCLHCGNIEGRMTTAVIKYEYENMDKLNLNWKELFPIENFKGESMDAETFGAESNTKKYGMIAAGIITAFALLPEIKKRF